VESPFQGAVGCLAQPGRVLARWLLLIVELSGEDVLSEVSVGYRGWPE
jgi:hypothetical protein